MLGGRETVHRRVQKEGGNPMTSADVVQSFQYDVKEPEYTDFRISYTAEVDAPVVMELLKAIPHIGNQRVMYQVIRFCAALDSNIGRLHVPALPMYIEMDDEDVYLEWIFERFRFGFYFFPDDSESTWGMTVENPDGTISEFGGKFAGRFDEVAGYVIDYAERHS